MYEQALALNDDEGVDQYHDEWSGKRYQAIHRAALRNAARLCLFHYTLHYLNDLDTFIIAKHDDISNPSSKCCSNLRSSIWRSSGKESTTNPVDVTPFPRPYCTVSLTTSRRESSSLFGPWCHSSFEALREGCYQQKRIDGSQLTKLLQFLTNSQTITYGVQAF